MSIHEECGVFGVISPAPADVAGLSYCEVNHQKGRMALAHNGNLSNAAELRSTLELSGAIFHTTSDTETIAYIITRERLKSDSIEEALSRAMNTIEGAYSLILMSSQKLICARDPHGFRPLCYGRMEDGTYIIASESCAVTSIRSGYVSYVINTRAVFSGVHYGDGAAIRRCAAQNGVTMLTSLDTVRMLLDVLEEVTIRVSVIDA